MRSSTRVMLRKHGWRLDRFVHNYLYFVFYYPYVKTISIFLPFLKSLTWFKPLVPIGQAVFNRYHSKVLSSQDCKKIITLNKDIRASVARGKQIVPYKYATRILFQEPNHIAVMDCPCKKASGAPESDINSCIAVGKGLTSFWLEHCAKYNARAISQEEALAIIAGFRKKNHITQAFFKVATGGCTGVICNCHPATCTSLQATRYAGRIDPTLSMTAKSGYSVLYDPAKCENCRRCLDACHFDCITFNGHSRRYRKDLCLGCELCVEQCPGGALSLFADPEKPLPLDIGLIENEAVLSRDVSGHGVEVM